MGGSAIGGAIGLLTTGIGMPDRVLADTPFASFAFPAVILGTVGFGLLAAAWLVWTRHPLGTLASLAAGSTLFGWIVGETLMVHEGRALQGTIFTCALVILVLAGSCMHQERTAHSLGWELPITFVPQPPLLP